MAKPRLSRRQVLACAVLAMIALVACKQLESRGSSGCGRALGRTDSREQAVLAAWDFRQLANKSHATALAEYADPAVRAKLVALEDDVWPVTDRKFGWGYLIGTSVLCAGALHGDRVPVAFYHPWGDVFLVLLWRQAASGPRIEDVEVLTGDYVRRQDQSRVRSARGWTERASYTPYAIGFLTAETTRAFERLFSAEQLAQGGFRSAANGLANAKVLQGNHLAAGKQLLENLSELAPILGKASDGVGEQVRDKLMTVTDQLVRGQASALLAEASRTPEPSRKALAAMTIGDWRRLKLVSFVKGVDRNLVVLSHGDKPDMFVGLLFAGSGPGLQLRRVDVLSFKAFVENSATLTREAAH